MNPSSYDISLDLSNMTYIIKMLVRAKLELYTSRTFGKGEAL